MILFVNLAISLILEVEWLNAYFRIGWLKARKVLAGLGNGLAGLEPPEEKGKNTPYIIYLKIRGGWGGGGISFKTNKKQFDFNPQKFYFYYYYYHRHKNLQSVKSIDQNRASFYYTIFN